MANGERVYYFRTLRGMTQKYLGRMVGFPESSTDIRLAQYESETRTPKAEIMEKLAKVLAVSPKAMRQYPKPPKTHGELLETLARDGVKWKMY